MSETFAPPAPGGADKVSLGVFNTAAELWLAKGSCWLSTRSLKGTWQEKKHRRRGKSILSSHAPLGAKATSAILKDALFDRIWLPEVREVTNSIRGPRPGRANLFLRASDLRPYWTYPTLNTAVRYHEGLWQKARWRKWKKREGGEWGEKGAMWQNSGV